MLKSHVNAVCSEIAGVLKSHVDAVCSGGIGGGPLWPPAHVLGAGVGV